MQLECSRWLARCAGSPWVEFSPQVALLQSSAPVQPAGACPKPLPGLRTRGSWRGGFPAIGFGTHLWPAQVSLPPGLCIEAQGPDPASALQFCKQGGPEPRSGSPSLGPHIRCLPQGITVIPSQPPPQRQGYGPAPGHPPFVPSFLQRALELLGRVFFNSLPPELPPCVSPPGRQECE